MPAINLDGFDTQLKPMYAIDEVLKDYYDNHINSKEAIAIIDAINCEWKM